MEKIPVDYQGFNRYSRLERPLSLERTLFYLTSAAWLLGPAISVEVESFHLFPFRILIPALILLFAVKASFKRRTKPSLATNVIKHFGFFGFWLFYAAMSTIWAVDKASALKDIIFLFTGVSVAFFTAYYLRSLGQLEKLRDIWIIGLVSMLALGLWEINTGNHLPFSSYVIYDQNKPSAVFYNTNDLAFFIALCLPFIIVWILSKRHLLQRLFFMTLLAAAVFVLAKTTSRAAQLGLLAATAFDLVILRKISGKARLLATAGLLILAFVILFPQQTREITEELGRKYSNLPREFEPGSARLAVATGVPKLMLISYGMGVGAGNSDHYLHLAGIDYMTGFTALHNWWLEILANYGIIIFVGYVIFYLSLFFGLLRAYRWIQDRSTKRLYEAILMGMVAFPIACNAVSSAMALPQNWMFLGFALALLNYSRLLRSELHHSHILRPDGSKI